MFILCSRVGHYYNIVKYNINLYSNAISEVEHRPDFQCIKDTQYLTLMGKLWNVYCESFGKYWLDYNTNAVNEVEQQTLNAQKTCLSWASSGMILWVFW